MKLCACAAGGLDLMGEDSQSTARCHLPRRVAVSCKQAGYLGQTAGRTGVLVGVLRAPRRGQRKENKM